MLNTFHPNRRFSFIVAIVALSASQSLAIADDTDEGYPAQIIVDISDGTDIVDLTTVKGSFRDESLPNSIVWRLLDSSGERQYIDLTDDLELETQDDSWKTWSFVVVIEPIEVGPCACTIVVTSTGEGGITSQFVPIFILPNTNQLPPTLHIFKDQSDSWASKLLTVNAISMTSDNLEPIFEYRFTKSPNVKCSNVFNSQSQVNRELPEDLDMLNSSLLEFESSESGNSNGRFSFQLDISQYEDGSYDLVLFAIDIWNQEFSYDCITFKIDNSPPIAIIEGPDNISESETDVTFDGANSYDETWGIQGLTYIWAVTDSSGFSDYDRYYGAGTDHRSITVVPDSSGEYQVKLTVIDLAGNSADTTRNLVIYNTAPVVRLTIDGSPMEDNSVFTLKRGSSCIVDATGSTDTSNDADNLRYVWRVNNVPTYEGSYRDLSWPEGVEDDFILTIEVIDDDLESSKISILVKDGSNNSSIPFEIIFFIISALFLAYAIIYFRSQDTDSDIPKWT